MSKRGSSLVEDNYVPMIGCFVAGFVVSRLMNHQDVVTGDVKEGDKWTDPINVVGVIVLIIIGLMLVVAVAWIVQIGRADAQEKAAKKIKMDEF